MSNHASPTERCAVAVLASREDCGQAYVDCLSEREQARYAALQHPDRRARWLAGRLAAKYLFLTQMNRAGTLGAGPPVLVPLTTEGLASFLPETYRHVEVLPQDAARNRTPQLTWDGAVCPSHRVSITHTDGTTCACIAGGRALGIDLEQAVGRVQAFYRGNFTKDERQWVVRYACETRLSPNWLYTLLWTLKEAVLKANMLEPTVSVWDFPKIDVRLRTDPRALRAASRQAHLGDQFLMARVHVAGPGCRAEVRVALTATRALILTVLNT